MEVEAYTTAESSLGSAEVFPFIPEGWTPVCRAEKLRLEIEEEMADEVPKTMPRRLGACGEEEKGGRVEHWREEVREARGL